MALQEPRKLSSRIVEAGIRSGIFLARCHLGHDLDELFIDRFPIDFHWLLVARDEGLHQLVDHEFHLLAIRITDPRLDGRGEHFRSFRPLAFSPFHLSDLDGGKQRQWTFWIILEELSVEGSNAGPVFIRLKQRGRGVERVLSYVIWAV